MAFSAPRFRSAHASKRPRHRRKETLVARRNRQPPQMREIHTTFEPSRLSPSWVAQAYEQIVPMVRRTTARSSGLGRDLPEPSETRSAGRVASSRG
jgi:hypothetical protein